MADIAGTKGAPGVWQRIVSEMPAHDVYIEAFWGRGTIAKKKRPAAVTIAIDRNNDALADARAHASLVFDSDCVRWLKSYFRLRSVSRRGGAKYSAAAEPGASSLPAGASTFGGFAWARHMVYLDPPYWGCPGYYRHELTEAEHVDLMRVFVALPCPAILSGYRTDLHAAELDGLRTIDIPTVNRAGKRCTETLWLNFAPPLVYHDVTHYGEDRRVRERITRRVRNWSRALADMPAAEQQAVFEGVEAARVAALGSDDAADGGGRRSR